MANQQRQSRRSQRWRLGFLQRIPLESISPRLAPWGVAAHATLTLSGSAWGIREALVNGCYTGAYGLYQAMGINVLLAFALSTATVVTVAEVIDTIMVIAHLVGQRMKAQGHAEGVAEGIAQGRTEGIERGRTEGEARKEAEVAEWYARLLESHPELKDAIEPPPIADAKPKAE